MVMEPIEPPRVVVAELTHRCPLRCAYCSNPLALSARRDELDTETWQSVMRQAGALGAVQAHLSGGEPLLRDDLEEIARAATGAGLYCTLITSGIGATRERIAALVTAGMRAVQVSFQDVDGAAAARVAGRDRFDDKRHAADWVRAAGASLTVNVVLHRDNLARLERFVALALELGADRLELAHLQFHGWATRNRRLIPSEAQIDEADRFVAAAKLRHAAELEILYVMPDLFRGRPKPCMGGWGRRALVVSPEGQLLPCHGAASLPLAFDDVRRVPLAEAWARGAAFQAFRGDGWMEEPCRSCPERSRDFGGCRCQALLLTGRVSAPDPACAHSAEHESVVALRRPAAGRYVLRGQALRTTTPRRARRGVSCRS